MKVTGTQKTIQRRNQYTISGLGQGTGSGQEPVTVFSNLGNCSTSSRWRGKIATTLSSFQQETRKTAK